MKRHSLCVVVMLLSTVASVSRAQAPASGGVGAGNMQSLLAAVESERAPPEFFFAEWIRKDAAEGARNRVLNEMEAGLTAFAAGYFSHAEALLSDAQRQIETIYADNASAQAARSKFVPEASKEFKGDPYERAMVGYYLGLIDLAKGDFDNARAGFRFAQLQDTMSASEVYQDDMALMQYLIAWSYWCEGNVQSAKEEFSRAQNIRPDLKPPQAGHNLLLLGELGNAPAKFTSGQYNELLNYRAGTPTSARQLAFAVNGKQINAALAEDLFFQAATRGGTVVENIRAGKASFRQGAETIAGTASGVANVAVGAAYLSALGGNSKTSKEALAVGLVAGVVSLVSSSVAKNTETTADSRSWTSLPAEIYLATAPLESSGSMEAGFFSVDGQVLQTQNMLRKTAPKGQCTLAYANARYGNMQGMPINASHWKALPAMASADVALKAAARKNEVATPDISDEGAALLDMVRMMRDNPNATLPEAALKPAKKQ